MEPRETGDTEAVQKAMNSLAPLDVTAAEGVLREAKEIMDELGVVFFLRQGTCPSPRGSLRSDRQHESSRVR